MTFLLQHPHFIIIVILLLGGITVKLIKLRSITIFGSRCGYYIVVRLITLSLTRTIKIAKCNLYKGKVILDLLVTLYYYWTKDGQPKLFKRSLGQCHNHSYGRQTSKQQGKQIAVHF